MAFLNFRVVWIGVIVFTGLINMACRRKAEILKSPPHYNFSKVYQYKLDRILQEISGVAWDSKKNIFYAVNDEVGKLFILDKESKAIIDDPTFGDPGDYEDVAILNDIPYILRSDGLIIKFVKDETGKSFGLEAGKVAIAGTNDFETMYSDPSRNALVIICKKCKTDDDKSISAFAFYPDSIGFQEKPLFVVNADKINELSPFSSSKFQPSAASINPRMQKLIMISSTSQQLVVADLNGNVESVHKLSKKMFIQPEGIAFKQNGDMYISNEGLGERGTLLEFAYTNPADTMKAKNARGAGYDFNAPAEKMELGKHLHEISGMAYVPEQDVILAENDEKGDIFTVDFKNKKDKVGKIKFGGKGDYEDIVYTDTAIYMLVSSGTVVQVRTKDSSFLTHDFEMGIKKSEFETMYLDADGQSLILLCKDCTKEKNEIRTAYRFDLKTKLFAAAPVFIVSVSEIQKMLADESAEFKPSAAGINPINGKLYIVASVGKLLVVASSTGNVEQVFRLNPELFNQPEGMTFAPNGDLFISNEGGEGIGTILKFTYKK